jgi:hypothetical protein
MIDVGPINFSADNTHTVPEPPIVGAIALLGGSFLL